MKVALLQARSGRVVARIPLPDSCPGVLEYEGVQWVHSHPRDEHLMV